MARPFIELERLRGRVSEDREAFRQGGCAPHVVFDDLLTPETIAAAGLDEAIRSLRSDPALTEYSYYNTRSRSTTGWVGLPEPVRRLVEELHSDAWLAHLGEVTGLQALVADGALVNGGVHFLGPGGFLNLHADELIHPVERHWRRRLNCVLYLEPNWDERWGGHLEVWDRQSGRQVRRIAPRYNRCVVTEVDANWHGIPDPICCPPGRARTSLTLWYYTVELRPVPFRPAYFVSRPTDPAHRRLLIELESRLFGAFHFAKRYLGVPNAFALGLMRRLGYERVSRP